MLDAAKLHMHSIHLGQPALAQLARRLRLPPHATDQGYLVHCAFGELFGEAAPTRFMIAAEHGRELRVLAYGPHDFAHLRDVADAFADPALHACVNWEASASKRMPETWQVGRRLGFEVRVCPIVRKAGEEERHRKGAEVDVFLARCWEAGEGVPVDREAVYRDWLAAQLSQANGIEIERSRVAAYARRRLIRRTQGEVRKSQVLDRPDVTFAGELTVRDPAAFGALLRRGVGRHRAFGFGMVLLKPAGANC